MDIESELPTDDAFMELDDEGSRGDAKPSESQLTLKRSWSQETLTASPDLCLDTIHLDFLVEKGLIDYDSLDQQSGDEAGDYSRRLTSASDLGGIAEIVNEMRNEFIGKLSSNVKGLRGVLIKDVMEPEQGRTIFQDHNIKLPAENVSEDKLEVPIFNSEKDNHEEELSTEDNRYDDIIGNISDINQFTNDVERDPDSVDHCNELVARNFSEAELEVPKFMNDNESPEDALSTEGNQNEDIVQLISDINDFTSEVERDPDNVDWSHFRANLLKIHRHYVQNPETRTHYQIGVPSSDISLPVDGLKSQAKYLRRKVQGLESKILNLDQTLEEFSENFKRSLLSKKSVDHEMVAISMMQDKISQRLSELENELRKARKQLFMGAKDADQKKQRVYPFHN